MLDLKDKNILVLAPHTDDETVGCGGFIHRAHNQGANVIFIAFSWCYKPELIDEFHNACTTLTPLSDDNNHIFNFKVRKFPSQRQEILEELIKLKKIHKPNIILCNASFDVHQDHNTIYNEAKRAFKDKTILGYCNPWNVVGYSNFQMRVKLKEDEIEVKSNAMNCYKTQCEREYFINRGDWIREEKFEIITMNYE